MPYVFLGAYLPVVLAVPRRPPSLASVTTPTDRGAAVTRRPGARIAACPGFRWTETFCPREMQTGDKFSFVLLW